MNIISRYDSPLGGITLLSDGEALTGLWLDGQRYVGFDLSVPKKECDILVFRETKEWLDVYFRGEVPDIMPKIRFSGSPFRKDVWDILLTIPYGCTMTYGNIADRIAKDRGLTKMSAQAVGGAVGHNPISIIVPCHRVLGANGALIGYGGGLWRKKALLDIEKISYTE